jgi:hypothetical protein
LTDDEAYRVGLDELLPAWPTSPDDQDAMIRDVIDGQGVPGGQVDGAELRRWFEDLRVDLVREWLIHPASLARVGYDGFATGAEDVDFAGYRELAADTRDDWEPSDLGVVPAPETQEDAA